MTAGSLNPPAASPDPRALAKRSLTIAGHRTSISLEAAFWDSLRTIARARKISLAALVAEIDAARGVGNLSSAIRVFVLQSALEGAAAPAAGEGCA